MKHLVAVGTTVPLYNNEPPFHPDSAYPELPFAERSPQPNSPYGLLRQLFFQLGYDREHYGTAAWNPLGTFIRPGQTVLLKPNFVLSFNTSGDSLFAVVTHPSLLRALVDYAYIALKGEGRIIIADCPQMDCHWEQLMVAERLDAIQSFYRSRFKFEVEVYDLREFALVDPHQPAYSTNRKHLPGDPAGSVVINLGPRSEFYGLPSENYYGADYKRRETIGHHQGTTHEYCVSKTVLAADVFLSVPKMKVHKKVGVTLNIKGLVGTITNKNYLIHYRLGTPRTGGDQLPDDQPALDRFAIQAQRWLFDHAMARQTRWGDWAYRTARAVYRRLVQPIRPVSEATLLHDAGNWYGNDSAWRMASDLAKIIFFANAEGKLCATPQRRIFCVVDGIVGGENKGPLEPAAKPCGCLVAGADPFAVDLVTTRLMGFDVRKLRQFDLPFRGDWDFSLRSLSDIEILRNGNQVEGGTFFDSSCKDPLLGFRPHPGWIGHMEV